MDQQNSKPRRVLILVQNLPVPFDRRVWLEATTLTQHGYKVSVICPKGMNHERSRETIDGVEIFRYRAFEADNNRYAFVLEFVLCWLCTFLLSLKVAATVGFDVIHSCNPPDTFYLIARFHGLFGKRFVFDQHDLCPELYVSKYPERAGDRMHRMLLALEKNTFQTADAVIATNESYKRVAVERGGCRPDHVFVVRSGPDPDRIQIVPPIADDRHGAAHVLGYLGTMGVQDGVDGLLRVVKIILEDLGRSDYHLNLVGGGSQLEQLKQMAEDLGIADHVTFYGRVNDGERFCQIMCAADVCISPDPPNPLNDMSTMNKTVEYMGFGKPVVAYALTETMVSGGDVAVYAEPGNERALAEKIIEVADDAPRCAALGERGRRRVMEHLGWEHSVEPLLAAYRCALGRSAVADAEPHDSAAVALAGSAKQPARDGATR